jgi:hypothetical protein
MSTVTIAVDRAKNVFELVIANHAGRIRQRKRFSHSRFEQYGERRHPAASSWRRARAPSSGDAISARATSPSFFCHRIREALPTPQQDGPLGLRDLERVHAF